MVFQDLNFEGALRFYFEDGNEKITKAIRLTNKSLVSEILPTLIEKFKPDLEQSSLLRKAKLYEVHDEDDREGKKRFIYNIHLVSSENVISSNENKIVTLDDDFYSSMGFSSNVVINSIYFIMTKNQYSKNMNFIVILN